MVKISLAKKQKALLDFVKRYIDGENRARALNKHRSIKLRSLQCFYR